MENIKNYKLPIGYLVVDNKDERNTLESENYVSGCFDMYSDFYCSVSIIDSKCYFDLKDIYPKLKDLKLALGSYKVVLLVYYVYGNDRYSFNGFVLNFNVTEKDSLLSNYDTVYLKYKGISRFLESYGLGLGNVYLPFHLVDESIWLHEISIEVKKEYDFIWL
jgi:hypothetical protein